MPTLSSPSNPDSEYSVNALHTTQSYRLNEGILYYRNTKSNVEHAIPLNTIRSQKWSRYIDQYFWYGLIAILLALIYFGFQREPFKWNKNHLIFTVALVIGIIQTAYWARFPRTYRLITTSGDAVSIIVDGKDPARSMQFIEVVQKEIDAARIQTSQKM